MLTLALVVLAQINPSDYPRVVRKDDGSTCMQSLDSVGNVVEQCRQEGQKWEQAAPAKKILDAPEDAPKVRQRLADANPESVHFRARTSGFLDPVVADTLSSAMTKKAWSAVAIWSAVGLIAGGVLSFAIASQLPEEAQQGSTTQGLIFLGGGVVLGAVGIGLSLSAETDIESITAR